MSVILIRKALETAAKGWAATQGLPLVFEDQPYEAGDVAWARSNLLPLPPESESLDKIHRVYEGVYQITIFTPAGSGPRAAEQYIASLDAVYSPSRPMPADDQWIFITRPMGARTAGQETGWRSTPISCTYRMDTVIYPPP